METKWYILKVLPGKERTVCEQLNLQISLGNIKNVIRFISPMTKEFIKVKSKNIYREKAIYVGYIYFETEFSLNDDELKNISSYPNVMSLNGDKKPLLLNKKDVEKIIKDDTLEQLNKTKNNLFSTGDNVLVIDGPFSNFNGEIYNINGDKVELYIKIFGRNTEVSLSLSQIRKI